MLLGQLLQVFVPDLKAFPRIVIGDEDHQPYIGHGARFVPVVCNRPRIAGVLVYVGSNAQIIADISDTHRGFSIDIYTPIKLRAGTHDIEPRPGRLSTPYLASAA